MTESKLYEFIAFALNMNRTDVYASGIRMNGNNVAEARGIAADYATGRRIEWYFDGFTVINTNSGETFATEQPETEPAEADETETETNEQEETKMKNAEFIAQVRAILNGRKCRSAWDRGVMQYAEELTAELAENINGGYITLAQLTTAEGRKAALLNGAKDWSQYSYGGGALIYDYDIAERLCNPSELKRTRNGERNPNSRETWLDCQARALSQASSKVRGIIRGVLYDLGMEVH